MFTPVGVLSVVAALCFAELGSMLPHAGGEYTYLKHAYGRRCSFSYAWFHFWVSTPGSEAIVATVMANYLVALFTGLNNTDSSDNTAASKTAAVLAIVLTVLANCFGVKESVLITKFLTTNKLVVLLIIILSGFIFAGSDSDSVARYIVQKC